MNEKKAKKLIIGLFLSCLCIALACFGFSIYLFLTNRGAELIPSWIANLTKAMFMAGIFFLILAFGYLLPILVSRSRQNKAGANTSGIFSETSMMQALVPYIPAGETLLAGIRAVSNETCVTDVFGKCFPTEDRLVSDEQGGIVALTKKKLSTYDVYLGITQSSLVITECEKNKWFYQLDNGSNENSMDIRELTSDLPLTDIGTCFPFSDIQNCEVKKGWMGSVKCFLTMKNGSYFKLMLPALGGLGGGMPHHSEYRAAIIARLGGTPL